MKKILLIDDEPDITSSVKKGLELQGFEVDAYTDPHLALSKFKPGMYDLAILDIMMPKTNSFVLYRQLMKGDNKIKICFLTAFDYSKEFKKEFPELDKHHFIKKPSTLGELTKHILKELESTKTGDELYSVKVTKQ